MRRLWNAMGDVRVAFVLLLAASATLFTGAFYAGGNFSLFMQLNRQRIQDWLPGQLVERFDVVWWIPLLFLIMGLLGVNTFICATNRVRRLMQQRGSLSPGRLFYLSIPSLIHFVFILIMIGHLTTFTTGRWQTLPLSAGGSVIITPGSPMYRVETIDNRFFPDASALNGRIAQTRVTLVDAGAQPTRLEYTQPVCRDGRYFLLDKVKKKKRRSEIMRVQPSPTDENCNKAHVYATSGGAPTESGQLLLIVSDPGLAIIITGLSLIMALMIVFFVTKPRTMGPAASHSPAATQQ
jgi:hypothetical protein